VVLAARRREAVVRGREAVERWRGVVDRFALALFGVLGPVDFPALERVVPVRFFAVDPRPDELRDDVDFPDDDDRREDELRLDFGCGISPSPP
jgi:hypothetical protein